MSKTIHSTLRATALFLSFAVFAEPIALAGPPAANLPDAPVAVSQTHPAPAATASLKPAGAPATYAQLHQPLSPVSGAELREPAALSSSSASPEPAPAASSSEAAAAPVAVHSRLRAKILVASFIVGVAAAGLIIYNQGQNEKTTDCKTNPTLAVCQ